MFTHTAQSILVYSINASLYAVSNVGTCHENINTIIIILYKKIVMETVWGYNYSSTGKCVGGDQIDF